MGLLSKIPPSENSAESCGCRLHVAPASGALLSQTGAKAPGKAEDASIKENTSP